MTALDKTTNIEAGAERQSDPFDSLWRFFSSTKVAIVLILLIAFVSFLGAVIVQAPTGLASDPVQYGQWLSYMRGKYGALTDVYNAIGLFNVYNVFWFKLLLVLLIFNTVICTINRLPTLWNSVSSPRVKVNESMFKASPIRASIKLKQSGGQKGKQQPVGDVASKVFSTLSGQHYKVFTEQDGGATHFYADRYGIFKLGTVVTHLSLVLLMVGAVMGGMFGFANDGVVIPEGKVYQVGFGENFSVRLDKFVAEFYQDGQPKDYYSDVTIIDGGKDVLKQRIRVNDPLEYKGVRFHQSFYGPAAVLEVKDKQGRTVFADSMPLDQGNGSSNQGWINLPASNVVLVASLPNSENPPLTVQFYQGNTALSRDTLRAGDTKTIGDYQVTFKKLSQFTGLRMVKDPGVPLVWLACALLVLGICVTLYFPRRRIWGRITGQELMLAGTADKTVNFRTEFDKLVEAIRGA